MGTFDAIGIAGSGMSVYQTWLNAISDNLANLNTVRPTSQEAFRARYVEASAVDYGRPAGAQVDGMVLGSAAGRLVYEPDNPFADAKGYVRYPDIDLSTQMTQLIMAQRAYQANAAVIDRAKESYTAALQIGR
ncbi:flagellar basal body rod C-terminal domain-containing protein [Isoptericola sp. b441]|uniref:Flagellar basal body rod C-terminal domain-containing protein n=1 Tax=Actinotalea lenta TaxID=3064654 RepID=A0ABT9D5P2_9CELL|nr:flagellar basal body rod C-terminal domain-containing protein [Isoptericola sp. b441]MDO8106125.1 flagellar basal body rod C-terminal domain-containing protein [Isoptericola sp. b441]